MGTKLTVLAIAFMLAVIYAILMYTPWWILRGTPLYILACVPVLAARWLFAAHQDAQAAKARR